MGDLQGTYVPKDYEDLYQHYIAGKGSSLAQTLVRHFVSFESDQVKEDLLHDAYARMLAKDVLKIYDPTKSNFGGVIFFVVRTVCVNYLKRKGHDPLTALKSATLEETSEEPSLQERGVMFLDRLESEDRVDEMIIRAIDAEKVVKKLKHDVNQEKNSRAKARAVRLHRLMDNLIEGYSIKECAAMEGVTVSTIHNWCAYLKSLVEGATADVKVEGAV